MNPAISAERGAFWRGDSLDGPDAAAGRRDWWYKGGTAVDEEIRVCFGGLVQLACARELTGWQDMPDGALALILLLDQFTRNLYRGTVDAYAGDACAFEIVNRAIDQKQDLELHPVPRIWLYHPFHHSEDVGQQDRGLDLLRTLRQEADPNWHAYVERSINGWTRHRNIVAEFGRFPHRNPVLGRESTPAEQAYIDGGGDSVGQGLQASPAG